MSVALIVPQRWKEERAHWPFLRRFWEKIQSDSFEIVECYGTPKAAAVADGLSRTDAQRLIITDADVLTDVEAVSAALKAINACARWAVPHARILRLTEAATERLIVGEEPRGLEQPPHPAVPGGGLTVMWRSTYETCPMPALPRREDEAWCMALTRQFGRPWRGTADLIHLWHEPIGGTDG